MQKMDVWLPEGKGAPTPAIIFVHGGGFQNGDRRDSIASRNAARRGWRSSPWNTGC